MLTLTPPPRATPQPPARRPPPEWRDAPMGPSLVAVSTWLGGLGATMGLCAAAGWTLSVATTCSERHVFKSKRVAGEYPRLQRFAPCDDEDARPGRNSGSAPQWSCGNPRLNFLCGTHSHWCLVLGGCFCLGFL